ncbi:MAG TPA: bifunctional methylenetetrahydrofolate dehydrogenase/methenyltetrahydrofolate cyclohydrolase FolD [Bryobacteraceae bacterium]|nr:bifunctional methylenetetrahydrofolate dehydrogenase/methenyltetrahydrofolate cyclohydrolase FolD [Bryobacteraceae bacterium]
MAQILDGTLVRDKILSDLKPRIAKLSRPPGLAVVLVGDDPASEIYVRNKIKACAEIGIESTKITPSETISTEELVSIVEGLNEDPLIDGILVQLPLPKHIDKSRILEAVSAGKDADGIHPLNVGHLVAGRPAPRACTPAGVIELLKFYNIKMNGRRAVVLGRSDIVGKPMALMLLQENATVTICHSATANLAEEARRADILIAAMGKPAFLTSEFIAPGATVIDVGTSRITDRAEAVRLGKEAAFDRKGSVLVGDLHPIDVARRSTAYTPVPGGVGPLTIAMLMTNTVALAEQNLKRA